MSVTHFNTATLSSGASRDQLRALTWKELAAMRGIQRSAVLLDMERFDIRAEVRVSPDALRQFRPKGPREVRVDLDENLGGPLVLTEEWQPLRAPSAGLLAMRAGEDPNLGAEYCEMQKIPDGYGGFQFIAERRPGVADLIEFRLPGDTALALAGK